MEALETTATQLTTGTSETVGPMSSVASGAHRGLTAGRYLLYRCTAVPAVPPGLSDFLTKPLGSKRFYALRAVIMNEHKPGSH